MAEEKKKFIAWVTRYALSKGIFSIVAQDCGSGMIEEVGVRWTTYYRGKDWHRTEEKALARAEEMRVKKIKSLEKQITKLQKMKF